MINKVEEYVKKHNMIQTGDTLIVGVSGGADSVCLLSVLSKLRERMELNLICAHVNHMFRETALRDEEYVQALCRSLNICCRVKREDVKKIAEEERLSFEEAGRNIRYAFFRELKEEFNASKIAVAHNKNDCAETVLFHLFRGSNLKGLGGIRPVHIDVIRPLLDVERDEMEAYLRSNHIKWQTDETNESTEYSRNYIRHEILPAAEKMCPGAGRRVAETAVFLRETELYMEEQIREAAENCCMSADGGVFIRREALFCEHPVIVSGILYSVLEEICGTARDLTRGHVQELVQLFGLQSGRQISLPGKVIAYKNAEGILVRKEAGNPAQEEFLGMPVLLPIKELDAGEVMLFRLKGLGEVKVQVLFDFEMKNIPQKTYTKWFDYDKITKCAAFRKRQEGDFLTIDDAGNHKKLKEYFIQEKIPTYKRDETWILADDAHVIWVPGYRISSYYKISEKTKRVLEISIGGEEDE